MTWLNRLTDPASQVTASFWALVWALVVPVARRLWVRVQHPERLHVRELEDTGANVSDEPPRTFVRVGGAVAHAVASGKAGVVSTG
jgi:hypothetical protein